MMSIRALPAVCFRISFCLLSSLALQVAFDAKEAHALVLDDFDEGNVEVTSNGVPESQILTGLGGTVGGTRAIQTSVVSGVGEVKARIAGGRFGHSESDAGVVGATTIKWDARTVPLLTDDYDGLGGIDITEDGSTGFLFKRISYDDPTGVRGVLTIEVFDAASEEPFNVIKSTATIFLDTAFGIVDDEDKEILYTDFTPPIGSPTGVDPTNVGAIVLRVGSVPVGTRARGGMDLSFDSFGTNGDCPRVPAPGQSVFDECGICGGDNSSCADCAGVPFGDKEVDECGVCGGDNSTCADCAGIPNGDTVVDECGICGGDNSSCADCFGVPFGDAELDQCGVCDGDNSTCLDCAGVPNGGAVVDECGVCEGDGSSCRDECPQDPAKDEPGVCGCGIADVDNNSNGTIDCLEDDDGVDTVGDGDTGGDGDMGGDGDGDGGDGQDQGDGSDDGDLVCSTEKVNSQASFNNRRLAEVGLAGIAYLREFATVTNDEFARTQRSALRAADRFESLIAALLLELETTELQCEPIGQPLDAGTCFREANGSVDIYLKRVNRLSRAVRRVIKRGLFFMRKFERKAVDRRSRTREFRLARRQLRNVRRSRARREVQRELIANVKQVPRQFDVCG